MMKDIEYNTDLQSRLGRIVEASMSEIYVFDSHTLKFETVNKGARNNLGYSMEELSKLTPVDIKPEFTEQEFRAHIKTLLDGKNSLLKFETIHERKNKTTYDVEVRLSLSKEADHSVIFAIINDISESKQLKDELEESVRRLKSAQGIAHMGNWELDLKKNKLWWSEEIYKIFEINPKEFEITYQKFLDFIHPDDREMVNGAYVNSVNNKTPYNIEHRLLMPDASIKWVSEVGRTLYRDDDVPDCSVGTVQDITEIKQMAEEEENLRKLSEKRYRNLIDYSPFCICEIDLSGTIISMSSKGLEMLGISSEKDVIGTDYTSITQEVDPERSKNMIADAINGQASRFEFAIKKEHGQIQFFSDFIPLKDEGGNTYRIMGIIEDVTEKNKLSKMQKYHQHLLNLHSIVVTVDPTGIITFVNDNFCKRSGYSEEEILGQHLDILKTGYHPTEFYEEIDKKIFKNNIWKGEMCTRAKDGSHYWVETTIVPLVDENGELVEYTTIRTDVTERKLTEEKLRHSQKAEALGQLSGGIAHDFNNLLGIISGNLEVMEMLVHGNEKLSQCIKTAQKGANRGTVLTKKLMGFSQKAAYSVERILCNDFLKNMDELIRSTCTTSISVKMDMSEDLWPVNVDLGDLEDAILNLVLNARDAMQGGGNLLIETANKVLDENFVTRNLGSKAGKFVMIAVSDTGTGMSSKVKSKILEPFYTTKSVEEGTGLGLSMVQGFINRADGYIKIHSELGEGSSFKLFLPQATIEIDEDKSNEKQPPHFKLTGKETILIVDDEEALRVIAERHLNDLGYKTYNASNAEDALEIIQKRKNINLLFTDVVMPGKFNGFELATEVSKLNPSIKVLLTSGFNHFLDKHRNSTDERMLELASSLLNKPYNGTELAISVRKTLDR